MEGSTKNSFLGPRQSVVGWNSPAKQILGFESEVEDLDLPIVAIRKIATDLPFSRTIRD